MDYYLPLLRQRLAKELEFYLHLGDRLDVPICLMLIYSEHFLPYSHHKIAQLVRRIDNVKRVDEHIVSILFFVADSVSQEVVINRMISFLQEGCAVESFHMGIACSNEDADDLLVRALQNMLKARDEKKEVVYDF